MTTIYTIPQKMSNSGTIHDIESDLYERDIVFRGGAKYAVVLAAYYGGKGYTTHMTEDSAVRAYNRAKQTSKVIIDTNGRRYYAWGDNLIPDNDY